MSYLLRQNGEIEVWFVHVRGQRGSGLQEGFGLDQRKHTWSSQLPALA